MQTESTETTKKVSKSGLIFNNPDAETLFKSTAFVSPSTYFSPKDNVSNMTWSSKTPCNENRYGATQIFHRRAGIQNCFVLNGGSDYVGAFVQMRKHGRFYRPVIAFRAARREDNFLRLSVNACGDFLSRFTKNLF